MTKAVRGETEAVWTPVVKRNHAPLYLSIADAIASDIASGRLAAGARLPAQRTLARALEIDFTTVSRAYAEARRRGLIEAHVGDGTFVRRRLPIFMGPISGSLVDMSMNLPPAFEDVDLAARMWAGIESLGASRGLSLLLRYQETGGTAADRAVAARWLGTRIPGLAPDRVLICAGAQGALLAVSSNLAESGDTICTESLTYAGFRSIAGHLRIRLAEIAVDTDGLIPDSFDEVCQQHHPKALYCTPTMHNPTTATMPQVRREEIIRIARKYQVPIIEDDAYGALRPDVTPLAAMAPDLVFHIASLSKVLSPALRIAYLAVPDERTSVRMAGALRATAAIASPLSAAVAARWIEDGSAEAVCDAIKREAAARRDLANKILPAGSFQRRDFGFHLWLQLPPPWTRAEFVSRLRTSSVSVVGSDAFALSKPPEAVRLGLGAATTREDLKRSLQAVADLLAESPAKSSLVV